MVSPSSLFSACSTLLYATIIYSTIMESRWILSSRHCRFLTPLLESYIALPATPTGKCCSFVFIMRLRKGASNDISRGPYPGKTIDLSAVPPSIYLVLVSDPWRAFWADKAPLKGIERRAPSWPPLMRLTNTLYSTPLCICAVDIRSAIRQGCKWNVLILTQ